MREIKLLDKETIDRIAAGEVVERPASIVKELMENSIDSGATSVSVEIKSGGIDLIRVTDNGGGIPKDQSKKAFLRHATSKIDGAEDLSSIRTLGFRGEALSSICAVSKVELCTKTADSITGSIYKIEGGTEQSLDDAGLPNGTTMIVRNVFYNVPARLKFLKSPATEAGYISDIVEKIALSNPDISVKFTNNSNVRFSTIGNGVLKDTVYAVFGRDIAANLLEVREADDLIYIDGFIGKPEIARSVRSLETFFINGRYVKDKVISSALEEAYKGYQMKGTFPFACFNIRIAPEYVDVNVHPSKMEVKFFDSERIYKSIYKIISERITRRENIPEVTITPKPAEAAPETVHEAEKAPKEAAVKTLFPEPFETKRFEEIKERMVPYETEEKPVSYTQKTLFEDNFISEKARVKSRVIGCVFDTYWIVEYEDKMYIIDQHAAHEKVLYEQFMERIKSDNILSQKITPSMVVSLSSLEELALNEYMEYFKKLGFEIEHFGGSEYAISAVPATLYSSINSRELFLEALDELTKGGNSKAPEVLLDRVATAACKAAVKGGNRLSFREAEELINSLLELENPYNCPHGRPTIISMSKYELEKKFKRIV